MSTSLEDLLPVLAEMNADRHRELSLDDVARRAAMSRHHAQRVFRQLVGESPKQYQLRLRLEAAAARLATTDHTVTDVAFAVGFNHHETFTRAFARHFGVTPSRYRQAVTAAPIGRPGDRRVVERVGPCIGLYWRTTADNRPTNQGATVAYDIERKTLTETPFLFIRRRIDMAEMATQLGEMLPAVFGYVMEAGLAMAGPPVVRYVEQTPAFVTVEAGIPLAEPADAPGVHGIEAGSLPAGPAAVTIHTGPYDTLPEAHAALDRWMTANDHAAGGAPWEVYLTDPGEVPDPAEWQTEVVWPIAG